MSKQLFHWNSLRYPVTGLRW